MGIFRTKKIGRYTDLDLATKVIRSKEDIIDAAKDGGDIVTLLHTWAEWREALARKRSENRSPLDGYHDQRINRKNKEAKNQE